MEKYVTSKPATLCRPYACRRHKKKLHMMEGVLDLLVRLSCRVVEERNKSAATQWPAMVVSSSLCVRK